MLRKVYKSFYTFKKTFNQYFYLCLAIQICLNVIIPNLTYLTNMTICISFFCTETAAIKDYDLNKQMFMTHVLQLQKFN